MPPRPVLVDLGFDILGEVFSRRVRVHFFNAQEVHIIGQILAEHFVDVLRFDWGCGVVTVFKNTLLHDEITGCHTRLSHCDDGRLLFAMIQSI